MAAQLGIEVKSLLTEIIYCHLIIFAVLEGVMFKNTGAILRGTLEELPHGKLALAARAMSYISALAGGLVALCAVLMISIGTMSYIMPTDLSFKCPNCLLTTLSNRPFALFGDPARYGKYVEKQLDAKCPELQKKSMDQDLSKCTWTPHTLSKEEIASEFKLYFTADNVLRASIRPLCWSIPVFLLAGGLLEASRCLKGMAIGRYFETKTVKHLQNFANSGLFFIILPLFMPTSENIVLNLLNTIQIFYWKLWPPHLPFGIIFPDNFGFGFDSGLIKTFYGFLICLYAFTMTMVATVMFKAAKIVKDHAEII